MAGDHEEDTEFLITNLGTEDVILGLLWLQMVNPRIAWTTRSLEILSNTDSNSNTSPFYHQIHGNCTEQSEWVRHGITESCTNEVWICTSATYSTPLTAKIAEVKGKQFFEELVPLEYH